MTAQQHHWRGIPITQGRDGRWHAKITVGKRRDGSRDRRHRSGTTPDQVKESLRRLMREVDAGRTPKPGRVPTLGEWLTTWATDIAPHGRRALRPTTLRAYQAVINTWIIPELGGTPIDTLEPDDLDTLYGAMRRAGRSESYVLKAHYVLSRALGVAMRRGRISRRVTDMVETPGGSEGARTPLPRDVVRRALAVAAGRRDAARWALGLAAGPRQGETLGLAWDHVDLEAGTITRAWQLQRLTWAHGCDDPAACARQRCRTEPCRPPWDHGCDDPAACRSQAWRCPQRRPGSCRRHTRACPQPCPRGCTRHASQCPQRTGGGLVLTRPKTWRPHQPIVPVAIPAPVVEMLRAWQRQQAADRETAGTAWRTISYPGGAPAPLVFTARDGAPVDPRRDWQAWQDILIEAGAPPARVHAMRHTTATTLLEVGVDIAVVQEMLGHADIRTTRQYAAVATPLTRAAADRMSGALFDDELADRRHRRGDRSGDREAS